MVELIHNLNLKNMYMQYESNQKSVSDVQVSDFDLDMKDIKVTKVTVELIHDHGIKKMCIQYEINQSSSLTIIMLTGLTLTYISGS